MKINKRNALTLINSESVIGSTSPQTSSISANCIFPLHAFEPNELIFILIIL